MDHPVKPEAEDCCNSGCNPCIFDVYEQQLKSYQKYLERECKGIKTSENAISELVCTQFLVTKSQIVCDGHKVITLKRNQLHNKAVWWKAGQHFIIKYVTADLKLSRAYTPIKSKKLHEESHFAIIVKKYEKGVMSNYLYNLKEGDITLWRGPYGSYELQPNKYNRIVMLAQGTGVTPFISIIDEILNNEDDMTRIILLVCYRGNAILFREDLYSYRSYWNFRYTIFISGMSNIETMYQEPIEYHKLNPHDINDILKHSTNDNCLICGSKDFADFYGKYLEDMGVLSENIFKF